MESLYSFIVKPVEDRYNNKKKVNGEDLILNTNIESFRYISKEAIVVATPKAFKTDIKPGDKVIIHHNIFRRYYDIKGKEKNGSTYFKDDMYFVNMDQVYMYEKNKTWYTNLEYCFVKPIKEINPYSLKKSKSTLVY